MAVEANVTAAHKVFLGEDKSLRFSNIWDVDGIPVNVAGFGMVWVLRKADKTADPALIEKTTVSGITVTGTYNVDPDVNTQKVVVTLADTDSTSLKPAVLRHSLKRTDEGSETILAYGDFEFLQATAR